VAPPQRQPGVDWYTAEHPALLVSLIAAAAVVGKVLLVARGDVGTALGLVGAGIPEILLGVAIVYAPVLTVYLVVAAVWWNAQRRTAISVLTLAVATIAMLYVVPLGLIAVLGIAAVLVYSAARIPWLHRWESTSWAGRLGLHRPALIGWIIVGSLPGLVFGPEVWLPPEELTVTGAPAFTGYVVEEDGPWTTVLREDTRAVLRLEADELTDRQACELPGAQWLTLLQLWSPPASLSACP
jgi:hypothetical protein